MEADVGQGEFKMSDVSTNSVQKQISELVQQIVHVIEAHIEEKDLLEDGFDSVKNGIVIMESHLQTEKIRLDSVIFGVGTMAQSQDAMLSELRSKIHILKSQDNQIVSEATDLCHGMRQELEAQVNEYPTIRYKYWRLRFLPRVCRMEYPYCLNKLMKSIRLWRLLPLHETIFHPKGNFVCMCKQWKNQWNR
jgi:hypothetical protein